jgi:predicted Zn finger-like uncharacterized protein
MKITCQACAAKYTIADEKVVGKTVKIRCKKCGANIVVNAADTAGSAASAVGPATADAPPRLDASAAAPDEWTVNVADGDQRTMSLADVVREYGNRAVTDESLCWKDGMADWMALRDIPELYAACTAGGGAASREEEDAATRIHEAPVGLAPAPAPALAGNGAAAAIPAPAPTANPASPAAGAPAAAAARRAGGARGPSADLFGKAAQAGGEDDVLTSAPAGAPEARSDDAKPTGARNENSVLFSLSALGGTPSAAKPAPESKFTATDEASGLIDIRQLSAQLSESDEKKKKQSRVDDIMNLGGGGAFAPSLSAPVLSAPPIEEFAAPAALAGKAQSKSKGILFAAIAAGVLLVGGAIGLTVMMMNGKPDEKTANGAASASASGAEAPASASAAGTETPQAAATGTEAPSATSQPSATSGSNNTAPPVKTSTAAATTAAATTATPPPEKTATAAPPPPTENAAPAAQVAIDMAEVKTRLTAIAGAVQSCKRGDVSGSGKVIVTFATNGAAQSAQVTGAPFEGTPTGACVASKFRGARVPAFSGSPVAVSKSFVIN